MRTIRRGLMAVVVAVVWLGGWSDGVLAATKAQTCEAAKNRAAGMKARCLEGEYAKRAQGKPADFAKCEAAFAKAFAKAEDKAGPGVCPTEGDASDIEALIDVCMADIASALAGNQPPPSCPSSGLPATGQARCWDSDGNVIPCAGTGQDGDIRAGAVPSYTDNGDGTITDNSTGLMWEKKSSDGGIHDQGSNYTWANAFAVHIAGLNAGAGFAGHTDWRVPNVKELQSIVNYENTFPAVSPAFNTGCVAACTVVTCSCTASNAYWSSSTDVLSPRFAWSVSFTDGGFVAAATKSGATRVRAVRGGL